MIKPSTISKRGRSKTSNAKAGKLKLKVIENAKRVLNTITICNIFVPTDTKNGWGNTSVFENGRMIKVNSALSWNLDNIRVKWEVTCGIFCRSQNGKHYIQYATIEAVHECLPEQISTISQRICAWMFENGNKLEKLCPFWLAVPRSYESNPVDLTLAIQTAHRHLVFNRIGTNFEHNCNVPYKDFHDGHWFDIPMDWDKFKEVDIPLDEIKKLELKYKETEDGIQITS